MPTPTARSILACTAAANYLESYREIQREVDKMEADHKHLLSTKIGVEKERHSNIVTVALGVKDGDDTLMFDEFVAARRPCILVGQQESRGL